MNTDQTPKLVTVGRTRVTQPRVIVLDAQTWRELFFGNEEQAHSWLGQHNYVGTGRPGEYVRLGQ